LADRLLGAADLRRLAADLDLHPAKALGQNFVVDANSVRRIVRAAAVSPDDVVVEVGPGLGSLTLALLDVVRQVVAVEIDHRLAGRLPETVTERRPDLADRLVVVGADALQIRQGTLLAAAGAPASALVANLPYNVAVPVLLHLLAEVPSLRRVLVMVQAEVADRLCAAPGSRTYGAPTVKLAWWGRATPAGAVPRTVFWPVPGVDSALVALDVQAVADDGALRGQVFSVVDAAFAQRRKTLRAALAGWAGSAAQAGELLRASGLDPAARAETLAVADFVRLVQTRTRTADSPPAAIR